MLYKYSFTLHSIHTRDRCPDSKKKGGRRGASNAFPCTCYTQGCNCKSTHMNLFLTLFLLPWLNGQCQNEEVSRVEVGGTHVVQAENIVSINRKLFHIVSFSSFLGGFKCLHWRLFCCCYLFWKENERCP